MEVSKPTALAACAAKQQRLDGLSIVGKAGSPGKTLAQLKVPSLKSLGDSDGALTAPVKPLKALTQLRPSALMSPVKPTVASNSEQADTSSPRTARARRQSSLKPPARTDSGNQGTGDAVQREPGETMSEAAEGGAASSADTPDEPTQKGSEAASSKPPHDSDGSEDEDFNFDDVEGEEGDSKTTTQPGETEERPPHCETDTRLAEVDVESLYDCPPGVASETSHRRQERKPKMFVPRASDIELFHVVLTEDTQQLAQYLAKTSPKEVLEIVDTTGRTLYHYAALSRDKLVQDLVFLHVNAYRDAQLEMELQTLMRKKAQTWMPGTGNGWVPPRVKELQRETTKQKCADWASICSSVDENGRSLFHYIATTTSSLITLEDDYEFCSVLRTQPSILSAKDRFKKLALHYAVETGNLKQVKWHFHMGVKLSQADVDLLLSFNVSRVLENVILRQLEAIDVQNYHRPASGDTSDDRCDAGVSTFALAKLQRITDDSAGRLHQLPLHRAAMFGNIRAVELLLEQGADPNARDANQWTPLHYCADEASAKHLAIAQLLLEPPHSVDVNAKSLKGRSPLHVAVRSRKRELLQYKADTQPTGALESKDRLSFVTFLHESTKADVDLKDEHGATPLLLACRRGDVGVARFLLRAGCDPTATGDNQWNPLHFAAIRGNPSMVQFLLSWDADSRLWIDAPDIQGRKPKDLSKSDSVRQMLVNLWTECYSGNVDQVRRLLLARSKRDSPPPDQAAAVSVTDKTALAERTPLHLVVLGYMNTLQLSTTCASSRAERIKQEKAAELKRTAPSRFLQTAVLVLQAGANVCAADKWGVTPLMLAASIKDAIFMESLLDRLSGDEDLFAIDADGNSALHYSYAFCQAQISTMLEDQMDDADIENKHGNAPFEMTGYRDKLYPKEYREFLRHQQAMRRRQSDGGSR
ncbi:hypothetical protein PHYPSEUDO_010668 [Phytophthora pseudosyringae]|uniref:Uncharacterized protein n=1 Tax=Phytophthora pseudosyringae TaxID=221518 RepID=A0A8T1WB99_9STRA|nr:hypothetical protein PHYPSEUDO_010668 [Phytophthora pseudosyringae]